MRKQDKINILQQVGFVQQGKTNHSYLRFRRPADPKGSLYLVDERITGSGYYQRLEEFVVPNGIDHKGYPSWIGTSSVELLNYLIEEYKKHAEVDKDARFDGDECDQQGSKLDNLCS